MLFYYWAEGSIVELFETEETLIVSKGYLFKRKKEIRIDSIEEASIYRFNEKGGCGYSLKVKTKSNEVNFVKTMEFEQIESDIDAIRLFFERNEIKFRRYER